MTIRARTPLSVDGVYLVEEFENCDTRGYSMSMSTYPFLPQAELLVVSRANVLRGLHYQKGMSKIVHCLRGAIIDVGVDLRPSSPTYGKHYSLPLCKSTYAIIIPDGVAHGIRVYDRWDEPAEVLYHFSAPYNPCLEGAVKWNDPELMVNWQLDENYNDNLSAFRSQGRLDERIVLSERDRDAPSFADYKKNPVYR